MGAFDNAPPNIKEMLQRLSLQETEEGRMRGVRLQPTQHDIFVVSPPKCGTTWVCQIVQSLRSGGDMGFEEINMVIPCVEMAHDAGLPDLTTPQPWQPQVYKTHIWRPDCPKDAGKYIFVVRDPMDAGPSFYHFLKDWAFSADEVSLEQFILDFYLVRGDPTSPMENAGIMHNMASWYPHRADPDVLWLHYEDLHEDLAAGVALIARFLGLGADDDELQALAVQQASLDFMRAHPTKYDEHLLKRVMPLLAGGGSSDGMERSTSGMKIREGKVGANKLELSAAARAGIQARWEEVMLPASGYAHSYEELRCGINAELKRPFAGGPGTPAAAGALG